MKAFLSHSSKDKHFVRQVGDRLGVAQIEYDEYTFDYTLNTSALRRALARSDLFVLFLSANSIKSTFVEEEIATALDFRAKGSIKRVMIFTIDDSSYRDLPDWLRSINVVTRCAGAKVCARTIEAELINISAETERPPQIYIPRNESKDLRKSLSQAPGNAPVAVSVVGHFGLGRRTFIQQTVSALYPRIKAFVQIRLDNYEGVNEFYRRLYEYYSNSSLEQKVDDFVQFAGGTNEFQNEKMIELVDEAIKGDEFILVEDLGGAMTDAGLFQPFITQILNHLAGSPRPVIGFVQNRMMPLHRRDEHKNLYFTFLANLDEEQTSELMSFSLREAEIDFDDNQLHSTCALLDGHPINARLALAAIRTYGIESFLADPSYLINYKRRRAEDFLAKIKFSAVDIDILSLLFDYRYLRFDIIKAALGLSASAAAASLRKLEDYCCIERRQLLYTIAPPLRDAYGRDKRLKRKDSWRHHVAIAITKIVEEYTGEDNVPLSLIDANVNASLRGGTSSSYISALILPSHYLLLARAAYDEDRRKDAQSFSKLAFDQKSKLSIDGQIEALRLWGLSSIRLADEAGLKLAIAELEKYPQKIARRHKSFLQGFALRLDRKFDAAEGKFLEAHRLAPDNQSINRELANLYRHQRDFGEAEGYARRAYELAPTNPYMIDILLETLLGKMEKGLYVNGDEIKQLFIELKRYGDVPGSSFYQTRLAQDLFSQKAYPKALAAANAALERTPGFLPLHFLLGDINLALSDLPAARINLATVNDILTKRGGISPEDEGRAVELEVRLLMNEGKLSSARDKLTKSQFLPDRVAKRLAQSLANIVRMSPAQTDEATRKWAQRIIPLSKSLQIDQIGAAHASAPSPIKKRPV